jgi:hypothetical protein
MDSWFLEYTRMTGKEWAEIKVNIRRLGNGNAFLAIQY